MMRVRSQSLLRPHHGHQTLPAHASSASRSGHQHAVRGDRQDHAPHGLASSRFKLARALTDRPTRTVPGPYSCWCPLSSRRVPRSDTCWPTSCHRERRVQGAGRRRRDFIQIDEPHHVCTPAMPDVAGASIARWTAWPPSSRSSVLRQPLRPAVQRPCGLPQRLPNGQRHPCLAIVLEFANRGWRTRQLEACHATRSWARGHRREGVPLETAPTWPSASATILRYVPPTAVANPDCGFWETPRWVCQRNCARWWTARAASATSGG